MFFRVLHEAPSAIPGSLWVRSTRSLLQIKINFPIVASCGVLISYINGHTSCPFVSSSESKIIKVLSHGEEKWRQRTQTKGINLNRMFLNCRDRLNAWMPCSCIQNWAPGLKACPGSATVCPELIHLSLSFSEFLKDLFYCKILGFP